MRSSRDTRPSAILVVLGCAAAVVLSSCGEGKKPPESARPGRTMVLLPADAVDVRMYPALIEPVNQVDLSFDVPGPVEKLSVQEGDLVKKGQFVGQIRLRDYEIAVRQASGQMQQAEAELKKMRAGARKEDILRLEAALRSANVVLDAAEKDLIRMKDAYAKNVATQMELDRAQEVRDKASEAVLQAQEELNVGRAGARTEDIEAMQAQIESLKAALDRAKADRDDATLRAPFEGLITKKYIEQHQNVQAKQPVVRLVAEEVEARVDVPEQDVLKRRKKESVKLTVSIRSRSGKLHTYASKLKKWSPEADPETGTFAVFLSVKIPDADKEEIRIVSGMSATVKAEIPPETQPAVRAHRVPLSAVFSPKEGQSCVWVVDSKSLTLSRRDVHVGEQTGGEIWILEGVQDGEEILTAGVHYVREGQKIRRTEPSKENRS